jgi:hypothetical protein
MTERKPTIQPAPATIDELRARYPEGIPSWMVERGYSLKQIDDLMQLRRHAFPKTAR